MPLNTRDDVKPWLRSRSGGFWAQLLRTLGGGGLPPPRLPQDSFAFTSALVALGAKMAMADGVAVTAEARAFSKYLEIEPGQEENIQRLYDLARQDASGFEVYAARINGMLADEPAMKRDVLECLLYIACADGVMHPAEDKFLASVAAEFGFSSGEFSSIRALFVHDRDSPYVVLDVDPNVSDRVLKTRYRQLVSENHPDRLSAVDAPPAVIKAATAKLASINAAYESIVKERASRMVRT